jgi:LacI family transcriptional regulator
MENVFHRQEPRGANMSSSIFDVARKAGVSISTVSRALNNNNTHRVNDKTREKVLHAARELGYSPSLLARALVTKKTNIIGILVPDFTDPYFGLILRGAEDEARDNGYIIIAGDTGRDPELELSYLRMLDRYRIDGVLFSGGGLTNPSYRKDLQDCVASMQQTGTVFVSLAQPSFSLPEVNIDNVAAMRQLVAYLVGLGHRRIAFISGSPEVTTSQQREQGYRQELLAKGLEAPPDYIFPGNYTYEGGIRAAERLSQLDPRPSAIVAVSDATAIGCLVALQRRGIKTPEEISIAGFNNVTAAEYVEPALTTIAVPMYQFGQIGMRQLLRGLQGEVIEPFHKLPHELVIRRSTAPPKERG